MTDQDDGDPDDPQLRALRAVWLSMPDEEPPERGLAELMAAARVKAEAMVTPSWWQRIVALLRRPPVLAVASVLVLIGGVVLIGQRRDEMEARPETGPAQTATGTAQVDETRDVEAVAPSGSAAAADQGGALAPGAAEEAKPTEPPAERVKQAEPPLPSRAPVAHSADKKQTKTATSATKGTKHEEAALEQQAKRDEPGQTVGRGAGAGATTGAGVRGAGGGGATGTVGGGVAVPDEDRRAMAPDRFDGDATLSEAPQAAPAKDSSATTTDAMRTTSRAGQYVQQAKSAIARGDCTAAKALMKRVAAADAALYRKTLASDSALKKCVAP